MAKELLLCDFGKMWLPVGSTLLLGWSLEKSHLSWGFLSPQHPKSSGKTWCQINFPYQTHLYRNFDQHNGIHNSLQHFRNSCISCCLWSLKQRLRTSVAWEHSVLQSSDSEGNQQGRKSDRVSSSELQPSRHLLRNNLATHGGILGNALCPGSVL